jgi:hypothetical protein
LKFEPNKLFTHLRQVSPSSSRRAPEFSNYQKAIIIALRQRAYKGKAEARCICVERENGCAVDGDYKCAALSKPSSAAASAEA